MLDVLNDSAFAALECALGDLVERLGDWQERFDESVHVNNRFSVMFANFAAEVTEYAAGNGETVTIAIVFDISNGDAVCVNGNGEIVTTAPCRSYDVLALDGFMAQLANIA